MTAEDLRKRYEGIKKLRWSAMDSLTFRGQVLGMLDDIIKWIEEHPLIEDWPIVRVAADPYRFLGDPTDQAIPPIAKQEPEV